MKAILSGCAVLLLAAPLYGAVPAHYLVFTVNRSGELTLTSRSEVMLATAPVSDPGVDDVPAGESVRVDATGFHQRIRIERTVRAEWANPLTGELQSRPIELDEVAFVIRVPASAGESLSLEHSGGHALQVELPPVTQALVGAVTTNASSANRVDLLIMGDGYRAAEQTKFETDAANVAAALSNISPYSEYRNYIQITTLFTASNQSGADHPNCATDPAVFEPDPKWGTFVDTAFDSTFCTLNQQRTLTASVPKVFARAAAVPDWDKILVLVNDTTYGGSGLPNMLVVSLAQNAINIAQHEFGHTLTGLADEYDLAYPSFPPCSDLGGGAPCEANVTNQTIRGAIKWSAWIDPSTIIPTPPGDQLHVGLFEGARYKPAGFYRPKYDCLMNHLGVPFCQICREAFILRLYRGFGGVPASGIDMIEPGSEQPEPGGAIHTTSGTRLSFAFALLQPIGGPAAAIQWSVDGVPVPGATSTQYTYQAAAGNHTVSVSVTDTTSAVRTSVEALRHTRNWNVSAVAAPPPAKRRAVGH